MLCRLNSVTGRLVVPVRYPSFSQRSQFNCTNETVKEDLHGKPSVGSLGEFSIGLKDAKLAISSRLVFPGRSMWLVT